MLRNIVHIHIPAFPIAVARVVHPELRARPVAVAPAQSVRGLVLSVSSEARREGLFKGMPLVKAFARCPGLTVIPPDPGLAERAGRELCRMAAWYTPLWEPSRPGHVYLDLTGTQRLWGRAKDTALRLGREIKGRLCLPGTAGVAGNKMVSGIASRIIPPEEILDVVHGREPGFMAPLSVGLLPGIGRLRRSLLLEELNITRVRDLAALDMASLAVLFGRQAPVIHQRALGMDPTPVYPSQREPAVKEEITLPEDENDDRKLMDALFTLVERCGRRLREKALLPGKAGILIRYADHMEVKRQCTFLHPGFWDFELYDPVKGLFFKACTRRVRVRFIRVWFRDLARPDHQLSLFNGFSPDRRKKTRLIQALDRIRERHGQDAIRYSRAA
jgi:DNA polymerase-4